MKISSCFLFFVLVHTCTVSLSQNFQYITYAGEAIPFTKVNQVLEDSRNFLWIASDQGLYRFNGTTFDDYNTSLKSRYIKSLARLNDSTLVFSNDSGIFSLAYKDKEVVINNLVTAGEEGEIAYPGHVFTDSKNRIWIAQLNGSLYAYQYGTNKLEQFQLLADSKTPHMHFGEDARKTVWVLIPEQGLFYLEEGATEFREMPLTLTANHFLVEGDTILIGGERLEKWTLGTDGQVRSREFVVSADQSIRFIARDPSGQLYLATDDSIFFLGRNLHHLQQVFGSNDPHRVEELPYKDIIQLYFSSKQGLPGGNLWVATPTGLGLLFSSYFKSVSGLSHDNVFAIGRGVHDEVLISQGNTFRVNIKKPLKQFTEINGLSRVTSISSIEGKDWFGTADGLLLRQEDGRISKTIDLSGRGGGIFYSFADQTGNLWFCQAPTDNPIVGIAKIDPSGNLSFYDAAKGLENRILTAGQGGRAELYVAGIGLTTYLYKYDPDTDKFVNHSQPLPFAASRNFEVHDIAVDDRGIVWVGTTDGLLKYDTERVRRVDLGSHTNQEIRSVCTMSDGSVWLATDTSGLLHLDASGNFVLFDEKSGTPSKIASYRALLLDGDEHLWVGTAEGSVYSALSQPGPMKTPPPDLRRIMVNQGRHGREEDLKFSKNDLVLMNFVSIAFPGTGTRYQYKYLDRTSDPLEIDQLPWVETLPGGDIRLQRLKGGDYTLLVRAQQAGGYSWSEASTFEITIRKPWFATWWGLALLAIAAILVFWYGTRFWVNRKVGRLEAHLFEAEKMLQNKETQLSRQDRAIRHQRDELKSVGVNMYLLYRLLRQIPKNSNWNKVLPYLEKLVQMPTGLDAIALAFIQRNTIKYIGFKRGVSGMYQEESEFNDKNNLSSYCLQSKKPMLITNYELEARQFIESSDDHGYQSRVYIPFEINKNAEYLFCAYAHPMDAFDKNAMLELQILVLFLSRITTGKLQ